jgi:excisionase family DNA binding protein
VTLLSITDAAERLHVHPNTVRARIADGTLPGYRIGTKTLRLKADDVDAMLRRVPTAEPPGRTGDVMRGAA